jgi:antitoxin YefM
MNTVYRLNANELDEKFVKSLRVLFKDKDIEIIVNEVDETAYLLRSKANKERLLKAVENVEKGENLVETRIGDLQ